MGVTYGRAMVRGKCRIESWRGRVVLGTSLRRLGILLALDDQRRVLTLNPGLVAYLAYWIRVCK